MLLKWYYKNNKTLLENKIKKLQKTYIKAEKIGILKSDIPTKRECRTFSKLYKYENLYENLFLQP